MATPIDHSAGTCDCHSVSPEERQFRIDLKEREEDLLGNAAWWWLSFADGTLGFLGVAILEGNGPATALREARKLGINPGGEVRAILLDGPPPEGYAGRLLSATELRRAYPTAISTREEREAIAALIKSRQ